ncbi:MAG: PQQ-dependent sugar dehydrogenase [Euzebya sp.]
MSRVCVLVVVVALGALGCASGEPDEPSASSAPSVGTVVVEGLQGPTQIAWHPDGRLLVAQIGEGEGTPTGSILAIDLESPQDREVLVRGLDTPTGVSAAGGRLWIMERTRLVMAPLGGGATQVVFADMPNNGRSEGSLTTLADGRLMFDTSGRRSGNGFSENSGTLWVIDPMAPPSGEDGYGQAILDGMKHAYAVAELSDGRLAVTEMSDGSFDGDPAPDELLLIQPDPDRTLNGGWPRCIGNRMPVREFDGTAAECEATVPSRAVFEPGATPTGVAVAPWDPQLILVTQWTQDRIVAVSLAGVPPATAEVAFDGIPTPQHLLVDGDRVLVSSHTGGQILALTDPG